MSAQSFLIVLSLLFFVFLFATITSRQRKCRIFFISATIICLATIPISMVKVYKESVRERELSQKENQKQQTAQEKIDLTLQNEENQKKEQREKKQTQNFLNKTPSTGYQQRKLNTT